MIAAAVLSPGLAYQDYSVFQRSDCGNAARRQTGPVHLAVPPVSDLLMDPCKDTYPEKYHTGGISPACPWHAA